MVTLAGAGILLIIMIGIIVMMLMMSQKRAQSRCEELSLNWATNLNNDDLVGQMNNMTGFSRELVYTSRETFEEIARSHPRMRPLALQLLDESRNSAVLVDSERKALTIIQLKALQKIVDNFADEKPAKSTGFNLPGLTTSNPKLVSVDTGYIESVTSSVIAPDAIPDLVDYDIQKKYLKPKGAYYDGNINAQLPSPDDDLDFKFASLAPPMSGSLAPPRLTGNNVFHKLMTVGPEAGNDFTKCAQLPSAVQIKATMDVTTDAKKTTENIAVQVSAASPGATLKLP